MPAASTGLRRQLFWSALGLIVVSGSLLALALNQLRLQAVEAGQHLNESLAHVVEEQAAHAVDAVDRRLQLTAQGLALLAASGGLNPAAAAALLREQEAALPFARAIWVLDAKGRVAYASDPANVGLNLADRAYFQVYLNQPQTGFHLGRPIRSRTTGNWLISAARPLQTAGGAFAGIVVAGIDPPYFERLWHALDLGSDGAVALFGRDGVLMMRSPFLDTAMGQSFADKPLFSQALAAAPNGSYTGPSPIDGKERLNAYRSVAGQPGLVVLVARTSSAVLAPWRQQALVAGAVWAAAAAVIGLLFVSLYHAMQQRLRADSRAQLMADRLALATDAAAIGVWDWDVAADTWQASPTYYTMLGYPPDTGPGDRSRWLQTVHPDDRAAVEQRIRAVLAGSDQPYEYEARLHHADGSLHWVGVVGRVLARDAAGKPTRLVGVRTDITERKQAEAALHASETRFRTSFDAAGIGMSLTGLDGRWLQVNPRLCEIIGYPAAELLQMDFRQIVHPDDLAADLANRQALLAGTAQFFQMEKRYLHRDGHPVWVHLTLSIVRDAAGTATHFVAHAEDISARKALEQALQQSQARLTATLDALPDLLFEVDLDGRYHDFHSPNTELLAAPPEVFMGQLLVAVLPAEAAAAAMAALQEAHLTGSSHGQQIVLDLPLGRRWFEMSIARKAVAAGELPRFIVLSRDITERTLAEAALRASEERYRQIVQTAGEGIWTTDADARTTFVNPRMAAILGYAAGEMIGRKLTDFMADADRSATPLAGPRPGAGEQVDFRFQRKDGSPVWCLLSTNPVTDADGNYQGTLSMVTDITTRQQAQASLQASLRDKEALLKEVHHRVKNNLQVIHSLLRLETGRNPLPATQAVLRAMQGRIQSMALLHESLYRSGTFAAVDLGAYLRQLATQALRSLQTGPAVVRLELALVEVQVSMDQAIPCGLLVNELISNCLKHAFPGGGGGTVRVALEVLQVLNQGAELRLSVSDNGVGLPADFEARQAQSLGLQLVADLTMQLNGRLDIGPRPEATFSVSFRPDAVPPAAGPDAAPA